MMESYEHQKDRHSTQMGTTILTEMTSGRQCYATLNCISCRSMYFETNCDFKPGHMINIQFEEPPLAGALKISVQLFTGACCYPKMNPRDHTGLALSTFDLFKGFPWEAVEPVVRLARDNGYKKRLGQIQSVKGCYYGFVEEDYPLEHFCYQTL